MKKHAGENIIKEAKMRDIDQRVSDIHNDLKYIHYSVKELTKFIEGSKMDKINESLSSLRHRIDQIENWQDKMRDL